MNCGIPSSLTPKSSIKYFTNINLIINFIQTSLNLSVKESKYDYESKNYYNMADEEKCVSIIYLGSKISNNKPKEIKFYLIITNSANKLESLIRALKTDRITYLFCLNDIAVIKLPRKIKLLNLFDCLCFNSNKITIVDPAESNRSLISKTGGFAKSDKLYGMAKNFIAELLLEKIEDVKSGKKKEAIYKEIYERLLLNPHLTKNLSEDNLFNWVSNHVRKILKNK